VTKSLIMFATPQAPQGRGISAFLSRTSLWLSTVDSIKHGRARFARHSAKTYSYMVHALHNTSQTTCRYRGTPQGDQPRALLWSHRFHDLVSKPATGNRCKLWIINLSGSGLTGAFRDVICILDALNIERIRKTLAPSSTPSIVP